MGRRTARSVSDPWRGPPARRPRLPPRRRAHASSRSPRCGRLQADLAAHEIVTGSTEPIALEGVSTRPATCEPGDRVTVTSLGNLEIRAHPDDAEAVNRVVTA